MIDDEIFAALRKQCQSDEEYERVRAQLAAQEESLPTTVARASRGARAVRPGGQRTARRLDGRATRTRMARDGLARPPHAVGG